MHSLGQRQGNRQNHALLRNEQCYLCYLLPQLGPARHNNVSTIDAFPQFTKLMEWMSNSVTYFLPPVSQCTHIHKHLPAHSQSYSIKNHYLSYEEGQKHQRSKQLVDVLRGNFICHYAAWQLLFDSDKTCVVSQKCIPP